MPQISREAFARLPLRVHGFLADVPLHDAWVVELPSPRTGITLDDFLRQAHGRLFVPSPVVRSLLSVRFFVGRRLGWDRELPAPAPLSETFATRLTPADRATSRVEPGTGDGPFRVVYRFENEQLSELINRTAHAGALSALAESAGVYRFYFAVYVREVSRLTPLYLAAIDPFRKLLVYPSLLRSVRATWRRVYGYP